MKIVIKNRWTAAVIFECEADSLRIAVELAVSKKVSLRAANLSAANLSDANLSDANLSDANLRDADLRDANLSAANLSAANLRDADLRDANLSDANLRDANLRDADLRDADLRDANLSAANLRDADLRDADLRDADLRDADLRDANLSAANLSAANLRDADLRDANLRAAKTDLRSVLDLAPNEVPGLYMALLDGKVDGTAYEGECACLVGTIAKVRGVDYRKIEGLAPDSSRPSERWFMGIYRGDTPENNPVSAVTAEWVREWMNEKAVPVPQREVIWK